MMNNELTLDQLTAIAGGVQMGPDGGICTDRQLRKAMEISKRMQEIFKIIPAANIGSTSSRSGTNF